MVSRAAVLCDGAIAASVWAASSPEAREELVRLRSWFLCVRGALLADAFALDDALVGLALAFLRGAERAGPDRLLVLERRLREAGGLERKVAMAEPLVRRFADAPDRILAGLARCVALERLMRIEPCWFAPGPRLLIGCGDEAAEVSEAAVQGWAGLLSSSRAEVEALRARLPAVTGAG